MTAIKPPLGFENSLLDIETIPAGRRFGRIYASVFPGPLGYRKTPSGSVIPAGVTREGGLASSIWATHSRSASWKRSCVTRRDGLVCDLPIEEKEICTRRYAEIETIAGLRLVDLREDHAIRMGVPTDVAKSSRQTLARAWSLAFHEHRSVPDGIIYPSRLNGHTNLAIFDRAISKLSAVRVVPLIGAPGLVTVINDLRVSLVDII
ncbi:RES family NAD+ phosphorylase [Sinorhizobium meliloti]|uniref:RES family NAD+ phosphorylase n=1 Tax=Rhizobium meliloti TaxID=382 RepID=UPI003F5CE49B